MHLGKTATACDGDFDMETAEVFRDLQADPASCSCATGMGCSNIATYRYNFHDGPFCPGIPTMFGNGTFCESVFGGAGPGGLLQLDVEDGFAPAGSCDSSGESEIGVPAWGEVVTLCGGEAGTGTCSVPGEQCTAGDPGQRKCVFQEGAADCRDAAPFIDQQQDAFSNFTDDRNCSECGCSQPTGSCLIESVEFFDGLSCSPTNSLSTASVNADEGCISLPNAEVEHFQVTQMLLPPAGTVSCDATGGDPNGAASPSDPVTICCLPPIAQ